MLLQRGHCLVADVGVVARSWGEFYNLRFRLGLIVVVGKRLMLLQRGHRLVADIGVVARSGGKFYNLRFRLCLVVVGRVGDFNRGEVERDDRRFDGVRREAGRREHPQCAVRAVEDVFAVRMGFHEKAVGSRADVVRRSEGGAIELPPGVAHAVGLVPHGLDRRVRDRATVDAEGRLESGGLALVERERLRLRLGPVACPLQWSCKGREGGEKGDCK